ncbi:Vacuolar protein sorting-associated protein 8 [Vigna unguiculata]|uniref:Vacuolar protein sorting-associated protein 8 n=1 Tax=Vigna unguiculata TaxID=3917 RepID=A0A4D6MNB5_VIGUN|nr:Vacuolar protein sorting-associated protein 8 [Vigna unguiculata]
MEPDIRSLLNSASSSASSSDADDDAPHRTIDEILNDCDTSSSSTSPPSSPSHSLSPLTNSHPQNPTLQPKPLQPALDSISRLKPPEFSDRTRVSRPFSSLLQGVRSNAKPGAALAAAAAASRSVPTPHAAAIISKRKSAAAISTELSSITAAGDDYSDVSSKGELGELSEKYDPVPLKIETQSSESASVNGERVESDTDIVIDLKAGSAADNQVHSDTDNDNGDGDDDGNGNHNDSSIVSEENRNLDEVDGYHGKDMNSSTFDEDTKDRDLDGNDGADKRITATDSAVETEETVDNGDSSVDHVKNEMSGGGSDEGSSLGDVSELVEERLEELESRRAAKRAEKKREFSMKPLELAEKLEKKRASTGLHLEEGAAAQPMRLEGVRRGSTTLGYFDVDADNAVTRAISSQTFRREQGSARALAVHANYIAVGMSKGLIVVFPSKYSIHHADSSDGKMLMLAIQGDRLRAPVTSMSFNQQGDLLLAGYGDGHLILWDVQKGVVAKVISGEHTAPVVHTLFLGQDPQNTRQFKAVTGDCKGLVLLHIISVVPLFSRFSIKTQCLLDGQSTGLVLSASPLLFDDFSGSASPFSQGNTSTPASSISSMMGVVGGDAGWKLFNESSSLLEEGVVVFVTHQTALVVRLSPTLQVYAQLSRPDGVREGSMPYTAWKYMTQTHSSTENMSAEAIERVSLLAIAWERKVLVAKLVKSELKVYGKWSLEGAAIGLAWLDDQMLVVQTSSGQLYLFSKDGTVIHQTSIAIDGIGGDDLVSYHTHFINVFGNPEKAYHNSVAVRGASIYILGPTHLLISRLLPWKERISVLRKAGDWMGALNMAMTLYDGHAHGVIDLPRTLDAVHEAIMPFLVELLTSYVDEVFSYISVAFCNQIGKVDQSNDSNSRSNSMHCEIKEQYTRVGGVAVEFCCHVKRMDILFDEIFSKFVGVQQRETFLELLEPYILKDMLGSLPPEIMQELVEYYSTKGWLQRVEQCVLHMDISSLDFNQVVRLCREHGLYSALVYVFNKGLDDFRAPLEELFAVLQNSQKESATALGYRMLVYLKYCFTGLPFPPGRGTIPPTRLPSLRRELVEFLLKDSCTSKSQTISDFESGRPHLNLYLLLKLDTEATLDVLRCAFMEDEISNACSSSPDSVNKPIEEAKKEDKATETQNALVQNTVDALIQIIDMNIVQTDTTFSSGEDGLIKEWPSKDIGYLFEFIAYYVAIQRAKISKDVLCQILEYLTSDSHSSTNISVHCSTPKNREKQVLALLEVLPKSDWDPSFVLDLCERAKYHQVCGLIHSFRHEYVAALDSYMKDVDEPIHTFSFINKTLSHLTDKEHVAFRSAVILRIPELVELSREGAFHVVLSHFSEESSHIITELHSHPRSLFLYLKTLIEFHLFGTLDLSNLSKDDTMNPLNGRQVKDHSEGVRDYLENISKFPKFMREKPIHVPDDLIELYLELLCQYEGSSVLKFLEMFDSYRVEHCLRLCQEYGIIDATAFLLERVGDVGKALSITLSDLNDKFVKLDAAVEAVVLNHSRVGSSHVEVFDSVLRTKEGSEIHDLLRACIGLCQRNTPRLNPEESEAHWFKLLDSFCDPLIDSNVEGAYESKNHFGMLAGSADSQQDKDAYKSSWKISKSRNGHILRKLLSQFIKEIVEGMIGFVHLPTIMSKLLSDNGSQEFGDFKLTILGMLGTYGFERRILDAAKSLIEDDSFYTMSLLKKGASHGYAPRSLVCCICNCLLTKNSGSSGIRIFNCGHAIHLQCEVSEIEASSRGSSSGCPLCVPNKKSQQSRNKSIIATNGLVNKFSSKRQYPHGSSLHPHDSDLTENMYGQQQISRFEILSNLQKNQRFMQIENLPPLKLAPPAVYHEKVSKVANFLTGESSNNSSAIEKQSRNKQNRELRVKGSSIRFPLKSSIFGKEKTNKR